MENISKNTKGLAEEKMGDAEIEVINQDEEIIENDYELVFAKPYVYEGKTYTKLDFSGFNDLTTEDLIKVQKRMSQSASGLASFMPEMELEYSLQLASRITKLPIEFFKGLKPNEGLRVRNKVRGFLYGQD